MLQEAFFTPGFVSGLWVIRGRRPGEGRKIFVEEYFLSDQNSRNHDIRHWTAAKGVAAEGLADAAVAFGAGPSVDEIPSCRGRGTAEASVEMIGFCTRLIDGEQYLFLIYVRLLSILRTDSKCFNIRGDARFSTCQRKLGSAAGILSGILRK